MCLLSYLPSGVYPNPDHLLNGAIFNRDGCGWAIACTDHDTIHIGKSLNEQTAVDEFCDAREQCINHPALFHSRLSTGGIATVYNCHPFYLGGDKQTVIAHNGILFTPPMSERRSDTRVWAEDVVPHLYRRLDRKGVQQAIHNRLKGSNKILFLTINPRYGQQSYLFGEELGIWVSGVWHSNDGWEDYTPSYSTDWKHGTSSTTYTGYDCRMCGTKFAVHFGICEECNMCNWCESYWDACECKLSSNPNGWASKGRAAKGYVRDAITVDAIRTAEAVTLTGTARELLNATADRLAITDGG